MKSTYLYLLVLLFLVSCGGEEKTGRQVRIVEEKTVSQSTQPQHNPFLSADEFGSSQANSAHTNAFATAIPAGTFQVEFTHENQVLMGVVNTACIAAADPHYIWAISTDRFNYINIFENSFTPVVSNNNYPEGSAFLVKNHKEALNHNYTSVAAVQRSVVSAYGINPEERMNKGTIAVCDKENDAFINYGTKIACLNLNKPVDPQRGIRVHRQLDLAEFVNNPSNIVGIGITYDGMLVFASKNYIGIVDRAFTTTPKIFNFETNEICKHNFCIDENNGIYVVTNKQMRKLVWTGQDLSSNPADGAWVSPYKTGKNGATSTPSLMGFENSDDKLAIITDGENNLVAFWRNEIPTNSQRIAHEIKLSFASEEKTISATGLAINNTGIFVANNSLYANSGDAIVDAIATVTAPSAQGCERFEWMDDSKKFKSIFVNKTISTATMKPAVSTSSNIVCVNGFYPETGWEITGLDWNTGEIAHRCLFGKNNLGNAAFATLQYFPNGDMLFNSIAGPCRIKLAEQAN